MADAPSGPGPLEDAIFIVGIIIVLVILWFASGGPSRASEICLAPDRGRWVRRGEQVPVLVGRGADGRGSAPFRRSAAVGGSEGSDGRVHRKAQARLLAVLARP